MRFLFFFILSTTIFSQNFIYKFDDGVYRLEIKGNGSYYYQNRKISDFFTNLRCNLFIKKEKKENGIFSIKITPRKVFLSINGFVVEDITDSESAISKVIPSLRIKIKENGEILKTENISEGIFGISPVLKFLPVFPERIYRDKKWIQKIPQFNFFGIPLSSLEFWYIYKGKFKNLHKFEIFSNQFIKESRENNISVEFKGINKTGGNLFFDKENGRIKSIKAVSDLYLKIIFKRINPLTLKLKIIFFLEKI